MTRKTNIIRYIRWSLRVIVALGAFSVVHYNLPQRDIVYVTGVDIKRQDLGVNAFFWASGDAGSGEAIINRDVRFIDTVRHKDAQVMVYRNEDTGWGWPWYFKFDSADLNAEARNLVSTRDEPQWAIITHYGWRNVWLSIYPNAVSIRAIDDPNMRLIPWFNIVLLTLLFSLFWAIRVRWRRFRNRRIDPAVDRFSDGVEENRRKLFRFFRRDKT